jgi:hypothetical protein
MLVKVLKFGTNWWSRLGRDGDHPGRLVRHSAFYNSTGVRCGRKVRRHWIVPGLIRFNAVGDLNPWRPDKALGQTFLCSNLDFLFGGNRLLLVRKVPKDIPPEWYLVVVTHELHGSIDFTFPGWRSPQSRVIAASQLREMQEVMLLMKVGDWVKTACGFWQMREPAIAGSAATLELLGEPAGA